MVCKTVNYVNKAKIKCVIVYFKTVFYYLLIICNYLMLSDFILQ